ncbi:sensor histidine kinase [Altererythrobacter xixiisoli]|uniref:histidine kinase n=1 Tax=Croceibacterium xixiisoli TaxID=1476466 RepID=A0A6I4TUK6_9SPHN|nr:HAMP domain-containing sensor histidine kinase [Croceibacterium xixiisoli]MXO99905.1 sensor histidine kinase [Croceibacterium xixiisoli]
MSSGRTDARDWLLTADEPLDQLQTLGGGTLPGPIVIPALLELVRKSRSYGLKLARTIRTQIDGKQISAWVEVVPDSDGAGCSVTLTGWRAMPVPRSDEDDGDDARKIALARQLADFTARLDTSLSVITFTAEAADLADFAARLNEGPVRSWLDHVALADSDAPLPSEWHRLNNARLRLHGSRRDWRATLVPLGRPVPGSAGYELLLVAEQPLPDLTRAGASADQDQDRSFNAALGREIAPVLRQPIARIIANAETIRTQLAGPLADEYSSYAADIAAAGQHLLALIDDLADLEVVEDEQFTTAPDQIDLADLARRAVGILGVRARENGIIVDTPPLGESAPAIGEFRRVLQILLNLLGNAIRYAPRGSHVWLSVATDGKRAQITVGDAGDGMSQEQQARAFEKFERLGRSGDGGSGLGLYISRRLAEAMSGTLTVDSEPGKGARFTLDLPADSSGG